MSCIYNIWDFITTDDACLYNGIFYVTWLQFDCFDMRLVFQPYELWCCAFFCLLSETLMSSSGDSIQGRFFDFSLLLSLVLHGPHNVSNGNLSFN